MRYVFCGSYLPHLADEEGPIRGNQVLVGLQTQQGDAIRPVIWKIQIFGPDGFGFDEEDASGRS